MFAFRKPAWWLVAVMLAAEVAFIAAAQWQWQRGVFKDQRAREFAVALASTVAPEFGAAEIDALETDFAAARLRGRLLLDRVMLHDNRIRDGQYGVDAYVPLALDDGGFVLVNLGWIAADRSRRLAPVVPMLPKLFDSRGLVAPAPSVGLTLAEGSVPPLSEPPRLRLNIDLDQIASESPHLLPMATRVFWPAPEAGSPFRRDWQPSGMDADRHRGYALQWASFAVASLVLFVMFHVRRKGKSR